MELRGFDHGGTLGAGETRGCWQGRAQGIRPALGGQPVGNVVPDLPENMFHLVGLRPERRVEDPGALERKKKQGGKVIVAKDGNSFLYFAESSWEVQKHPVCGLIRPVYHTFGTPALVKVHLNLESA